MDLDDFEEYLADKPEHERWELIGGRVIKMMVGARWQHHFITRNLSFELTRLLREKGSACHVFTETFWLKERFLQLAAFPDLMVKCGQLEPDASSLSDPIVLAEVVSPGSAERDRGEKWDLYSRLPSLRHYLLIERERPAVDILDRNDGRSWEAIRRVEGLEGSVDLPALGVSIAMKEIYRDVFGSPA
jgi:Uma2 family endonuclease